VRRGHILEVGRLRGGRRTRKGPGTVWEAMARLPLASVCSLGVLLLMPQAATGGGWWSSIDVNRSHVAAGQSVEVDATVTFSSAAAAEVAERTDRFSVYLLRGFDYAVVERAMRKPTPGNWWSLGGAEAIEVGQVTVSVSDVNLGRAIAAFTVPELPPATYHLMLCDTACTEPLADVIPASGFTVVADPATARLATRADRLERRIRNQTRQLAAARTDADRALVAAQNIRSEVEQLEARVSLPADASQSSPPAMRWAYAGWFVAGVLIGALCLLVRRRRQSRTPRPATVVEWSASEEELRPLLSSESSNPHSAHRSSPAPATRDVRTR
jgi:hypothetical protein